MRRGKCIEKKERNKSPGLFCFLFFPIEHCYIQYIFCFFFFFRNQTDFIQAAVKLLSYKTRGITSLWMSSNQTWGTEESLANLAKLSATTFPFLRTWEKDQELSCKDRARVSSMTFPNEARQAESAFR